MLRLRNIGSATTLSRQKTMPATVLIPCPTDGNAAVIATVESVEDNAEQRGIDTFQAVLDAKDLVVGVVVPGNTSCTTGVLREAAPAGALGPACNRDAALVGSVDGILQCRPVRRIDAPAAGKRASGGPAFTRPDRSFDGLIVSVRIGTFFFNNSGRAMMS